MRMDQDNFQPATPALGGRPFYQKTWFRPVVAGVLGVIIVCVALNFLVSRSLPGSAFYGMKTGVVEQVPYLYKKSQTAQLDQVASRLEARLQEVQRLIVSQSLTAEEVAVMAGPLDQSVDRVEALAQEEVADPVEFFTKLNTVASIMSAIEALTYKEVEDETHQTFIDFNADIDSVRLEVRQRLAETSPELVTQYIEEGIASLEGRLDDVELTVEELSQVANFIDRANLALVNKKYERAVAYVADAHRIVDLAVFQTLPLN